jgi:hypothetical protein
MLHPRTEVKLDVQLRSILDMYKLVVYIDSYGSYALGATAGGRRDVVGGGTHSSVV